MFLILHSHKRLDIVCCTLSLARNYFTQQATPNHLWLQHSHSETRCNFICDKFMIRIIVPWDGMEVDFLIVVNDRKH